MPHKSLHLHFVGAKKVANYIHTLSRQNPAAWNSQTLSAQKPAENVPDNTPCVQNPDSNFYHILLASDQLVQ